MNDIFVSFVVEMPDGKQKFNSAVVSFDGKFTGSGTIQLRKELAIMLGIELTKLALICIYPLEAES